MPTPAAAAATTAQMINVSQNQRFELGLRPFVATPSFLPMGGVVGGENAVRDPAVVGDGVVVIACPLPHLGQVGGVGGAVWWETVESSAGLEVGGEGGPEPVGVVWVRSIS